MSKLIFLLNKAVTRLYKIVVHKSTNAKIYCLLNNKKTTGQMKNCFKALFVQMPQGTPKDILLLYVCHKHHSFKFNHWTKIRKTSFISISYKLYINMNILSQVFSMDHSSCHKNRAQIDRRQIQKSLSSDRERK